MYHTRGQHSRSHLNALTIGIPMTRRYTCSKIPRCRTEHVQERSILTEEDEEIFPHFCPMGISLKSHLDVSLTCEREFIPHDHVFLFCSEDCRRIDQATSSAPAASACHHTTDNYPFHSALTPAPRDIIPQASPSRPTTGFLSSASAPSGIVREESPYNHTSNATGVQAVLAVLNSARKAAFVFQGQKGRMVRRAYDGTNDEVNVEKS